MINGPGEVPDLIAPVVQPPAAPIQSKPDYRPAPEPDRVVQADKVELSPQAKEVRSLVKRAQAEPEVRPAVVAEVQQRAETQQKTASQSELPAAKVAEKLLMEG